ncbi:hypothetical protein F4779DRAFT_323496 [Xylariaceae sp. FL0662B]|nr:hypothetical protein F4779DRAFT_323496 [Xylariaceae sp. FL0662B]
MGSSFEAVRASSPCIGNSGGAAGGGGGNNGVSAGSTAVTNRAEAPAAPTPAPGTADPSLSNSTPSASTATTTTTTTTPTTTANSTAILHTHRQNHNSSKLPAFRFADLQKESLALPLPSLLHNHNFPPSPVSPDLDQHRETQSNAPQETPQHEHEHEHKITNNSNQNNSPPPQEPEEPVSPKTSSPVRSRASTFQTQTHPAPVPVPATSSTNVKRSASLDCSTAVTTRVANSAPNTPILKSPLDSTETIVAVRPQHRRAPLSANSIGIESSRGGEITQGQRELLLPKSIQKTASDDRRSSVTRRPPVSYKPPVSSNGSGGSASIPPIRAFRSSGERRSLVLDMNTRSMRAYDVGDDYGDSNHRDRTLRALEGRRSGDASHMITPPDSAGERPDGDDSGDLFLKIAREDPSRRVADRNGAYGETQSAIVSQLFSSVSCFKPAIVRVVSLIALAQRCYGINATWSLLPTPFLTMLSFRLFLDAACGRMGHYQEFVTPLR